MSAWELLKDGMPWQAARTAIEFSLGTLSWAILGGFLITAVYF